MLLAIQECYELFAEYGFFAREICDKCGIVLGAVRFTRRNESQVYCSRECRGDAHRSSTHRQGRPRKYKTGRERRAAKTRQQQIYRSHPNVEKTVRIQSETKNLQTQKSASLVLGYTWTWRTPQFEPASVNGARVKTRVAHSSARGYCFDGANRVIEQWRLDGQEALPEGFCVPGR